MLKYIEVYANEDGEVNEDNPYSYAHLSSKISKDEMGELAGELFA